MTAYKSGYVAYERGNDIDSNPYSENDAEHDELDDGWKQAEFSDTDTEFNSEN